MEQKKIIIIIASVSILAAILVVAITLISSGILISPKPEPEYKAVFTPTAAEGAIQLALTEAQKWKGDAKLADVSAENNANETGQSVFWLARFSSKTAGKGKGFEVAIKNNKIVYTKEIVFYQEGKDLPPNLISSEEAVAKFKGMAGYQNLRVISQELVYNEAAKKWRWGIKTEKGVVSVEAEK